MNAAHNCLLASVMAWSIKPGPTVYPVNSVWCKAVQPCGIQHQRRLRAILARAGYPASALLYGDVAASRLAARRATQPLTDTIVLVALQRCA